MEFSVSKTDLVRELSLSQGVVERRTTIPILSNVMIDAFNDRIVLTATDLELGLRCSCPAKVKQEGSGTIPLKKLNDYVKLLPDAEVHIKFTENQWATISCGRSKGRIAGMGRENYPELPQKPEDIVELPVALLSAMIERTIFAIAVEESRFTLNGALMVLRPKGAAMVSTDGHRLALVEVECEFPDLKSEIRAILPRKAMQELQRLAQGAPEDAKVGFSLDDNHLFFQLGERLLLSRKLTGTFPDYERVLPREHPHSVELDCDLLSAALERVSQFGEERAPSVRMLFAPGEMKVYSSVSDTAEGEEVLPVVYDGAKTQISFNARYLTDFTRAVGTPKVQFLFRDAQSAGEMRPLGGDGNLAYRYVVMPMRV